MTRKDRQYDDEVRCLTSRNVELQRRLTILKNELNSQGHQVDSWLDSCSTDIDHSISTQTASEADMYRNFDENDDHDEEESISASLIRKSNDSLAIGNATCKFLIFVHHTIGIYFLKDSIDSKTLLNSNRKSTNRPRPRPAKRKLQSIPTTNLLQTLQTSTTASPPCAENLLDFNVARHLHLDEPCNLLTDLHCRPKESLSLAPITDIRYEIVDMFTKGTTPQLHQPSSNGHRQISPLPSIASLMNRHSSQASPLVSPTKQTIGINTDPLTTSITNILDQPTTTS